MLQFLLGLDSAAGSSSVSAVVVSPVIGARSAFRNPPSPARPMCMCFTSKT